MNKNVPQVLYAEKAKSNENTDSTLNNDNMVVMLLRLSL